MEGADGFCLGYDLLPKVGNQGFVVALFLEDIVGCEAKEFSDLLEHDQLHPFVLVPWLVEREDPVKERQGRHGG